MRVPWKEQNYLVLPRENYLVLPRENYDVSIPRMKTPTNAICHSSSEKNNINHYQYAPEFKG